MAVLFSVWTEEIPSDEDEVNENRSAMQQQSSMPPGQSGEDEDEDEDDYWDDDGFEGTPLEEYSTPLDYDNGEDEYRFFTSALLRKSLFFSLLSCSLLLSMTWQPEGLYLLTNEK